MSTQLSERFLGRYRLAALIQAIEGDLRTFIRDYLAPYSDADALFGDLSRELHGRAIADRFLDPSASSLVEYLDFGDSFALLNHKRQMLPDDLADTVRSLTLGFQTATPIRNRIMHGRPLRDDDEEQVAQLGQAVTDSRSGFRMTEAVVKHLVEDQTWTPFMGRISTREYGTRGPQPRSPESWEPAVSRPPRSACVPDTTVAWRRWPGYPRGSARSS